jgi:hypothetical protein
MASPNSSATHPAVLATSIDPRVVAVLLKHLGTAAVEISEVELKEAGRVTIRMGERGMVVQTTNLH